jgi:peptidoglycan/LPS O-acetylase OafA/YrhL
LVVQAWLATGPGITDRPAMFVAGLPLATLASVGVCAACVTTRNVVGRLLEARPLRWLGRVSYGGYLAHYPIYFAFGYELTGMSNRQALTVITLSLVAAVVIERIVERPFRHLSSPARRTTERTLVGEQELAGAR